MRVTPKPLTVPALRWLTQDALVNFFCQSEKFQFEGRPGLALALCNEPIADMNVLVVGAGADTATFEQMALSCLTREMPFLVMIFPDASPEIEEVAARLGLAYAVTFPKMVREDEALEAHGNPDVVVSRAATEQDRLGMASVMVSAYSMQMESVCRAMPRTLFDSPALDVFVGRLDGEVVGSVLLTYHGDTCGIWAMGTDTTQQRGGIGRRVLSGAMVDARERGIKRFFLGATPAGLRLYQTLGFQTVCEARVWVYGETHQA